MLYLALGDYVGITKAKKISIVGNSGAGKSTLAGRLGERLRIEVHSVDMIYWLPGWELRDHESYKNLHSKWLDSDAWIIEGVGYWREMERRMSESDSVIFLDVPVDLCKVRAEIRIQEEKKSPNPHITSGCIYRNVKERQMKVIEHFHSDLRPRIQDYLSGLERNKVIVLSDCSELNIDDLS
jgi:adenylate kinase family enzyme